MRDVLTASLLLCALMLGACSFSTDFVVVNESGQPMEITYKIGETSFEPLNVTGKPATLEAAQLSSREWRELASTEYLLDREQRTVTVSLSRGMALRLYRGGEWSKHETGNNFVIKEIGIKGANGEMTLKGDRVYKSFVPEAKGFFGPPTLATLTYK